MVSFDIPVMKTQKYGINEIFEKNLLFLIPFYIFSHESRFEDYGRMEQAKETAFNLRTIGLEEETIANMVNVHVSVIREWFAEVVS